MKACEIRQANSSDSASVAKLFDAAFAPLRAIYAPKRKAVDRQAKRPDAIRIVAGVSGRIVGTVEVDRHGPSLRLVGFAVHPEFQRQGIGRSIVDWVIANLTADSIELATIRQTGNVAVFERMGFNVVAEKVADWCVSSQFERLHEVTMVKALG